MCNLVNSFNKFHFLLSSKPTNVHHVLYKNGDITIILCLNAKNFVKQNWKNCKFTLLRLLHLNIFKSMMIKGVYILYNHYNRFNTQSLQESCLTRLHLIFFIFSTNNLVSTFWRGYHDIMWYSEKLKQVYEQSIYEFRSLNDQTRIVLHLILVKFTLVKYLKISGEIFYMNFSDCIHIN